MACVISHMMLMYITDNGMRLCSVWIMSVQFPPLFCKRINENLEEVQSHKHLGVTIVKVLIGMSTLKI